MLHDEYLWILHSPLRPLALVIVEQAIRLDVLHMM